MRARTSAAARLETNHHGDPIVEAVRESHRLHGNVLVIRGCPFCSGYHLHSLPPGYRLAECPEGRRPPRGYYVVRAGGSR